MTVTSLLTARHNRGDQLLGIGLEAHIPASHDAHQILAVEHRDTRNTVCIGQVNQLTDRGTLLDGNRVLDHTAFELFDPPDLLCLLGNGHTLVDDADATFLCHGNRKAVLCYGIHGRRHHGQIEIDLPGQARRQRNICRYDL